MNDGRLDAARRHAQQKHDAAEAAAATKATELAQAEARQIAGGRRRYQEMQPTLREFVAEAQRMGLPLRKIEFVTGWKRSVLYRTNGTHRRILGTAKVWVLVWPASSSSVEGEGGGSSPGWYVRSDGVLLRAEGTDIGFVPKKGTVKTAARTGEVETLSEDEEAWVLRGMGECLAGA